ncbi:MAG: ABC transporter ATP-binding protein [Thermoprotei archaeon]|nr:MAG: ABC transporter ATP-binding protein [Thermoprotei archaeon]
MPLLVVQNVEKSYGEVKALKGVSLTLNGGELLALLGPNGAGKSTLIKIISGISRPDKGLVEIEGDNPAKPSVRTKMGLMPQEDSLYDELTGEENMMFYSRLYGLPEGVVKNKIKKLIDLVGLSEAGKRRVKTYSGGMRKRLSLAIALLNDPQLLILDEPTTGMDPAMRRETWNLIQGMKASGIGILLATHYMDEAEALADRVAIMDEGRIIVEGSPDELKDKYGPASVIEVELYTTSEDALKNVKEVFPELKVSDGGFSLTVFTQSPDTDVPTLIEKLYESKTSVKTVKVRRPSLEDVFMKLTGKRLRE